MKDYALAVYSLPNCQQCTWVKSWLDKRGIECNEIRVDQQPWARDVLDQYGIKSAPGVIGKVDGQIRAWGGFSEANLEEFHNAIKDEVAA